MNREITPLDLDKLEQRLLKVHKYLTPLLAPRMPPNYLGTQGAKVTLAIARREIGYAAECLKTAYESIEDARQDSGNFKITNQ